MDLVLHIGLPKTASSSMQRHLSRHQSGFIGKLDGAGPTPGNQLATELLQIATHPKSFNMPRQQRMSLTLAWRDRLVQHAMNARVEGVGDGPITISHEALTAWPRRGYRSWDWAFPLTPRIGTRAFSRTQTPPLAIFLDDYLLPAWDDFGVVRVGVVLRNQPEWLASLYAENSSSITFASQSDFESQVHRLLTEDDPLLDLHGLVSTYVSVLGWENLAVLLFENIGDAEKLSLFYRKLHLDAAASTVSSVSHLNRRSSGSDWIMANWKALPEPVQISRLGNIPRMSKILDGFRDVQELMIAEIRKRRGSGRITLDHETRSSIQRHVNDSNRRLADMLAFDIGHLGY